MVDSMSIYWSDLIISMITRYKGSGTMKEQTIPKHYLHSKFIQIVAEDLNFVINLFTVELLGQSLIFFLLQKLCIDLATDCLFP